jgi:putative ATPase
MKDLGYGEGYRYDPDESGGVASQEYLPDGVAGQSFYRPGSAGFEESIKARLERWSESKNQARRSEADNEESSFPPS